MFSSLVALSSLALVVVAAPGSRDAVSILYTFTDDASPENIAVRANGDLIINSLSNGRVYTIDPTASSPTASVLAHFDPQIASGVLGIAEHAPDKFAVTTAHLNFTTLTADNVTIWSIDLNGRGKGTSSAVTPRKIADLPEAGVANGLTKFNSDILLAADSSLGIIWSINTRTGIVYKAGEDDALKAPNPNVLPLGVNGVHVSRDGSRLYFSNTNTRLVSQVRLGRNGEFVGSVMTVFEIPVDQAYPDDFILGKDGSLWVTAGPNFVDRLFPNGTVVALDQFINTIGPGPNGPGNPTAVAFGRGSKAQERILYVVAAWGVVYAVDTTQI